MSTGHRVRTQNGICRPVGFRQQGYQVLRARHSTIVSLDLLVWSPDELVLMKVRWTRRVPPSLHAITYLYRENF